ncbi:tarsal-less isoform 2A [Bombyx mori]|uniref:Tal-like protein 2A n=1 Tax=Bombyx mori TaxID=7091 RepID=A3RLR3_BOMMO|nr:tarsal-less isoform 2A [Bombyx mori]ABO09846.1 tal-like protein 2A [Bombyx mori]
MELTLDPTGQY